MNSADENAASSVLVQWGARRRGIDGTYGDYGNVVSVSYRIKRGWKSPNPTLSAKHTSSVVARRLYSSERSLRTKPFRERGRCGRGCSYLRSARSSSDAVCTNCAGRSRKAWPRQTVMSSSLAGRRLVPAPF